MLLVLGKGFCCFGVCGLFLGPSWGSFGLCGIVVANVVVVVVLLLLLPGLRFVVLGLVGDGVEAAAAADFLLCKGGLVVPVLGFALLRTDGALACRDGFGGSALGFTSTLLLAEAAAVMEDFRGETTPPSTCCFDFPVSGLSFRSLALSPAPEFSLSAFRRAGFFLGFLVEVGLEGCWVVFVFVSALTPPTLFDDEVGIVDVLAG